MAVKLDIVDGSGLDETLLGSNLTRVVYVSGLDAGAVAGDPSVLLRSLSSVGMPQLFDAHPSNTNYFCNRRVVKPETDSSCIVDLNYFKGVVQGSTWLMTESTTTIADTTQIHPTGKQIILQLDTGTGASAKKQQYIANSSYPRAIRKITFEGSIIGFNIPGTAGSQSPFVPVGSNGSPTTIAKKDQYTAAVNCVNSKSWQGLGVGFWWFGEWSVSTPDRGASNVIRASFATKITEDWSSYEVLRDTSNGKLIAVDPTIIASLKSTPYVYDVLYAQTAAGKNTGIAKVGNFPLADFIPLFGA